MPFATLASILLAAVLQTAFTLLHHRTRDRLAFMALTLALSGLVLLPLLLAERGMPAEVLVLAAVRALVYAAFSLLLGYAAARGDMSLVFPLSRGGAPVLLAAWTAAFLGEVPSAGAAVGLAVLGAGIAIVARSGTEPPAAEGSTAAPAHTRGDRRQALVLAALLALCISASGVVDASAVRGSGGTAPYASAVLLLTAGFLLALMVARGGAARIRAEWAHSHWRIAIAAAAVVGNFALLLRALQHTPAAYVAAAKEISIVFTAVAGWLFLREAVGWGRALGSVLIVAGIACVALLG